MTSISRTRWRWRRDFLHGPGLATGQTLFTFEDFRRHLNSPSLDAAFINMFLHGKLVDLGDASCYKVVQRRKIPFVNRQVLERYFAAGAACVLEALDVLEPDVNAFAAVLDKARTATFSNVTAFFSQRGQEAYRGHFDTDDVLVLHVAGEKRWRLHQRVSPRRIDVADLAEAQRAGHRRGPLRPGDVLFIRSHTPHRVETMSAWSLHISFDLCDRTVNLETALDLALRHYDRNAAYPLTPTRGLLERLYAIMQQPGFEGDLTALQAQERQAHAEFRRLLSTNRIGRLDRLSHAHAGKPDAGAGEPVDRSLAS